MTKTNFSLTARQREDIMKVYGEIALTCHSQQEAYIKVASHPAPRYYVSPKQAFERLRRMVVGDFSVVDAMTEPRRRMYYSLFEKLKKVSQRKEFIGQSLHFICQFLVSEPAPEFFLSPVSVQYIFNKCKRYGKDFRDNK
jgi:hypothetical protein|nr:MAG TPA: hypothetical protein [Caudoviricetes sp.]